MSSVKENEINADRCEKHLTCDLLIFSSCAAAADVLCSWRVWGEHSLRLAVWWSLRRRCHICKFLSLQVQATAASAILHLTSFITKHCQQPQATRNVCDSDLVLFSQAIKTVSSDSERFNDRVAEIKARPKVEWVPKPWPPKSEYSLPATKT